VLSGAVAGRCAAEAVLSGRPEAAGRSYRRALRARFGRHLRDVALAGRLARAPRVLRAGVVAASRDEAVFDRLVDVGLADGVLDRQVVLALLAAAVWT
jgi:hypothetical protein